MTDELKDLPAAYISELPSIPQDAEEMTPDMLRSITDAVQRIVRKVNGQVSFGDGASGFKAGNLDAANVNVVTPTVANTEFPVLHRLGRKPTGYFVVRQDKAVRVYDSSVGSWTERLMYLKADVATATLRIVVY